MKRISAYFLGLLILSSCAFHGGMMTGNAELNSNSEIVDFAIGEAQAVRVFMIGGLNSKTLVKDAKEDLYSRYPLKKGQAYANVVVDFQTAYFLIVDITTATVSADVVNLDSSTVRDELQEVFTKNTFQAEAKLYTDLWVQPGDSVFLVRKKIITRANVSEILSEKKVTVLTKELNKYSTSISKLYTDNKNVSFPKHSFNVGDSVTYNIDVANQMFEQVTAVVKGINPEKVIISYRKKTVEVSPEKIFNRR